MTGTADTIRVVIPLTIRKRNGRPKILPPDDVTLRDSRAQDPHVLRAIALAWSWRRQLETGAASTIQDIAAEKVSDRFVRRMMRLAYLSPDVLEHLVIRRLPPALSLDDLVAVAERPWPEPFSAEQSAVGCLLYARFPRRPGRLRSWRFSAASGPRPRPVPALVVPVEPPRSKPGRSTATGSGELSAALSTGLPSLCLGVVFAAGVLGCFSTMILFLLGSLICVFGGIRSPTDCRSVSWQRPSLD
jgi:hypothetical protein